MISRCLTLISIILMLLSLRKGLGTPTALPLDDAFHPDVSHWIHLVAVFLSTFTFYFCLILIFSLAFSDYCFCPQKIKQERDWNFNFRLLSTENCFSLRNQCFAKMRQIHISMIHHKTRSVLLQKYRIDKFSINIKSKYPTSFSYQVNCVCVR